jgi:hypothetical protein
MIVRERMGDVDARCDVRHAVASRETTCRRLLLLIALFTLAVTAAMHPILDPDIWWHLRTGAWIVEHGNVPTTELYSRYGMGKPWVAYSWLFEVLIYGLYWAFGPVGLVLYTTSAALMIAVALHALVRRFEPRFPITVALTALGLCSFMPHMQPRPWLLTILFYIIELDILMAARRSGDTRRLFLLPPLFALWANVHIQFVYGLFVLCLAIIESIINGLLCRSQVGDEGKSIPASCLLTVMAASTVMTLATPYHLSLYQTVFELIGDTGPFNYVEELLALKFRSLSDWCILATALGGVFVLGWRREVRPFPYLLLAAGAFLSFRARRDVWFVVVAAIAIMATGRSTAADTQRFGLTKRQGLLVSGALVVMLVVVGWRQNITEHHLEAVLSENYPVAAAAVVEARGYPGPLYNHFNWGGYLIWRLPHLPVAMDGRTNVYGDARIMRAVATWTGKPGWDTDAELAAARVVIASVDWPLAALLRLDTRFKLAYEDAVAAVFVATSLSEAGATTALSREGEQAHTGKEALP